MFYDALLLIGVSFFGFMVPNIVLGVVFEYMLPQGFLLLNLAGVAAVYFIWFWSHRRQTLAMRTWKIELRSADGGAPRLDQLLLRYMLAWSGLLFHAAGLNVLAGFGLLLFFAGLLWALFDRDRQFLHDRLSGTRLVSMG
jgi:uncharacterized RDD family membrane protein YckC